MSGGKEPSPGKQSTLKDKGPDFAIELQPTANKGGATTAKTEDLFGTGNEDESKIPKKAQPQVVGGDVNASGDDFENKYEDQTKKKVVKKKKKKVAVPGEDEEMQPMMAQQMPQMMQAPNGQWMMLGPNGQWMPMMNMGM